ncbi:MAG: DinB family protein [Gemmatimonadales bacterium]|nr:DinB family protein [Gemmatimonadales bacterium]
MRTTATLVLLTLATAMPLAAQEHEMKGGGFADIKPLHSQFLGWMASAAEQMPEADYSYRPTADVRTFGQMIGHVAGANYTFCAAAKSEESPSKVDFEKVTSKAALIAAIKGAAAYCETAYAMPHGKEHDEVNLFGMKGSRLWALTFNISHNAEHYGNLVTYMRMKGMTPPSSQRS